MNYKELRQFLFDSNADKLSPVEKDVFLYYSSRIGREGVWNCPDNNVANEIGRSRNSVCEARNSLKKRAWISESEPFRIRILKQFSVGNATEKPSSEAKSQSETRLDSVGNAAEMSRNGDSEEAVSVGNSTERVGTATDSVGNSTAYKDKIPFKQNKGHKTNMSDTRSDVENIFAYWQTILNHPNAKLTRERRKVIEVRLRDGYTVDQLRSSIDGCRASPYHMGQNEQGTVYDELTLIFRNGSKVEQFIGYLNRKTFNPGVIQNGKKINPTDARAARAVEKQTIIEQARTRVAERDRARGLRGPNSDSDP